jgi:hypothetical protein
VRGDSTLALVDGWTGVVTWHDVTPAGLRVVRRDSLRQTGAAVTSGDIAAREVAMSASAGWSYNTNGSAPTRPPAGRIRGAPPKWSVATTAFFAHDGALWVGAPRDVITRDAPRSVTRTIESNRWTVFPADAPPFTVELPETVLLRPGGVRGHLIYGIPVDGEPGVWVYELGQD